MLLEATDIENHKLIIKIQEQENKIPLIKIYGPRKDQDQDPKPLNADDSKESSEEDDDSSENEDEYYTNDNVT